LANDSVRVLKQRAMCRLPRAATGRYTYHS